MQTEIFQEAEKTIKNLETVNTLAKKVLPSDIENIIKRHAKIAVATVFIPFGGLDIAVAAANVWSMYLNINKALGLNISDNLMKSVCSGVVANLISNLGISTVISQLKWTGIGYFAAVAMLTPIIYAFTITAGWIYLKAVSNMALHDSDIDNATKEVLKNYSDINRVYKNNK